jgi:hypothetical protein
VSIEIFSQLEETGRKEGRKEGKRLAKKERRNVEVQIVTDMYTHPYY